MPEIKAKADNNCLKSFSFHGLHLEPHSSSGQAVGDCPFCGRESKLWVNIETSQWDCKVCALNGNITTFLRLLWEQSDKATNDYEGLAEDRGLLNFETLMRWGAVRSTITDHWMAPGYGLDGKLNQLYVYLPDLQTGKYRLLPTPKINQQLYGLNLFDSQRHVVYLVEGYWNSMVLWEILRQIKLSDGELLPTGSESSSLLADANVVGFPGCGAIGQPFEKFLPLFAGKTVVIIADNDHSRTFQGRVVEPAGYSAIKRAVKLFSTAEEPPHHIQYLKWGVEGFDPALPSGYDVRDHLSAKTAQERMLQARDLLTKIEPIPSGWIQTTGGKAANKKSSADIDLLPCESWEELLNQWRKCMRMVEGLERGLSVGLACITSTKALGTDQLWVKLIGPAGCGKSTLCEAFSTNKKYVTPKSTLTGFHSGYKSDADGKQDNSLMPLVKDKTLVTKDGDTLIQSGANTGKILAQARDLYDGSARTHYGNQMGKNYEGHRMTWILCGTPILCEHLDHSELGERFLDSWIMEGVDEHLENEIVWQVVNRADRNMCEEADGKFETRHDPDLVRAMQLTGGYIGYLRTNAKQLLNEVVMSEEALWRCAKLGIFTSFMRASPSVKREDAGEKELASRLSSQLTRLAKCLAVVLNRKTADEEVMRRVRLVALDTSRGKTLDCMQYLYRTGTEGISATALAAYTNQGEDKVRRLLAFMSRINAVEDLSRNKTGLSSRPRWRLTERLRKLYKEVIV